MIKTFRIFCQSCKFEKLFKSCFFNDINVIKNAIWQACKTGSDQSFEFYCVSYGILLIISACANVKPMNKKYLRIIYNIAVVMFLRFMLSHLVKFFQILWERHYLFCNFLGLCLKCNSKILIGICANRTRLTLPLQNFILCNQFFYKWLLSTKFTPNCFEKV